MPDYPNLGDKVFTGPIPVGVNFGNSWVAQGVAGTDYSAKGVFSQLEARLFGRLSIPLANNLGYSGQSSTQIMANLPALIACMQAGAKWVNVEMLINDPTSGVSPAESAANVLNLYNTIRNYGGTMVIQTVPPRSDANNTTAVRQQNMRINDYMFNLAAKSPAGAMYVADVAAALTSGASSISTPISPAYNSDGVHPLDIGAWIGSQPAFDIYDRILSKTYPFSLWRGMPAFDRVNNPIGWATPNPSLWGTAGTAGAGVTGSVPDNWTLARTTGTVATAVASKVAGLNGGEYLQIVLGATGAGAASEFIELSLQAGSGILIAGEKGIGLADVSGTGLSNVLGIYVQASGVDFGIYRGLANSGITGDQMPVAFTRIAHSDVFTKTGSDASVFKLLIVVKTNAGVPTGTLTIKCAGIKVVA